MIYPNDIKSKQFSKGLSGYKMEEVDSFLDEVAADYTKMITDNAELVKKIEVVVAKLEEYRSNEESISNALLNAQKLNEQVVREGKNKADLIIREATFKAERLIKNAQKEVEKEQETLDFLRKEVSDFRARLFSIYRSHLDLIDSLPAIEEEQPEDEQPENEQPADEADVTPEETVPTEEPAADELPEDAPADEAADDEAPADEQENVDVFAVDEPDVQQPAEDDGAEAEDTDDGQLFFGGAAERFKDIDIKFGSDYDYKKD